MFPNGAHLTCTPSLVGVCGAAQLTWARTVLEVLRRANLPGLVRLADWPGWLGKLAIVPGLGWQAWRVGLTWLAIVFCFESAFPRGEGSTSSLRRPECAQSVPRFAKGGPGSTKATQEAPNVLERAREVPSRPRRAARRSLEGRSTVAPRLLEVRSMVARISLEGRSKVARRSPEGFSKVGAIQIIKSNLRHCTISQLCLQWFLFYTSRVYLHGLFPYSEFHTKIRCRPSRPSTCPTKCNIGIDNMVNVRVR